MFRKQLDRFLAIFLVVLMALMVFNVLWQVASRYLLKAPSSFTDELAGFTLIWVGLLGASYATGQRLHLAIDLLPCNLKGKAQKRLNLFIHLLVILFALLVMVVGGSRLVYITLYLAQTSASLEIPLGYVYTIIPISGVFIIIYSILNLLEENSTPQKAD